MQLKHRQRSTKMGGGIANFVVNIILEIYLKPQVKK